MHIKKRFYVIKEVSLGMVFSNPKVQKALLIIFVVAGLTSTIGLAWENQFYVGTFSGYNDLSARVQYIKVTIISNNRTNIIAGVNVTNPGIYAVEISVIKVYITLNDQFFTFATISTGASSPIASGDSRVINSSIQFVHEPTTSAFIAARDSEGWNWHISIDMVFDLGFLLFATRRFSHDLVGTTNL
jgi:hypothetical protein